jgi:hypothetical protein
MIPKIVLTGGPCGGKSTAVQYIQTRLPDYNIKPIVVSELATMMFHSGIKWKDFEPFPNLAYNFQIKMIQTQMSNEDMIYSFAHIAPGIKKVLICDRGTIDNLVYSRDEWHEDILSQVGTRGFLKRRYDGIIHLNSLAHGEGYKLDNVARYEDREMAIHMDNRTWDMWSTGPDIPHSRISHNVDLDTKMEQVIEQILEWVK